MLQKHNVEALLSPKKYLTSIWLSIRTSSKCFSLYDDMEQGTVPWTAQWELLNTKYALPHPVTSGTLRCAY